MSSLREFKVGSKVRYTKAFLATRLRDVATELAAMEGTVVEVMATSQLTVPMLLTVDFGVQTGPARAKYTVVDARDVEVVS